LQRPRAERILPRRLFPGPRLWLVAAVLISVLSVFSVGHIALPSRHIVSLLVSVYKSRT
jgi:hypothetical protein